MPSMKCHQCGKVKRCAMFVDTTLKMRVGGPVVVVYLCRPCARELGYTTERNRTHDEPRY